MTDLGDWPSSETKQCAGVTVDDEQNAFSSPKCSEYNRLPGKAIFCGAVPSRVGWKRAGHADLKVIP